MVTFFYHRWTVYLQLDLPDISEIRFLQQSQYVMSVYAILQCAKMIILIHVDPLPPISYAVPEDLQ